MTPYYLYTHGKLKGPTTAKEPRRQGLDEIQAWEQHLQSLNEIAVHPDLVKLLKEGQHLQEGVDFVIKDVDSVYGHSGKTNFLYSLGVKEIAIPTAEKELPHAKEFEEWVNGIRKGEKTTHSDLYHYFIENILPAEKEESQEPTPTIDELLKQMKEVEEYRKSLQTSMSVECLLKELTIDEPTHHVAEKAEVWNRCVVAVRERIKGKHLIVDSQLSDLWDAAAREALDFLFRELENRIDTIPELGRPGIKSLIATYKETPWPLPDKAGYLKEHFGIL
jgi:hypothetical protein